MLIVVRRGPKCPVQQAKLRPVISHISAMMEIVKISSCYIAITSERKDRKGTPRKLIRAVLVHSIPNPIAQPGQEAYHLHATAQYNRADCSCSLDASYHVSD
jgi:hypothetical protein